jgi:hypothetical protein
MCIVYENCVCILYIEREGGGGANPKPNHVTMIIGGGGKIP